jgi:hypothetical protein
MKRQVLSIIVAIVLLALLYVFAIQGIVRVSDISAALAAALIVSTLAVLGWGFRPNIRQLARENQQNTLEIPVQKGSRWLSKLKRVPVKKGRRAEFWETTIVMMIGGAVLMGFVYSYSPASISQEAILAFLVAKYTALGVGILMLALSVWLTVAELVAVWELRSQPIKDRKAAQLNFFREFDEALEAVQEVHDPDLKVDMLYRFKDKLTALCKTYRWEQAKDKVGKVIELIPQRLSIGPQVYVQFLTMLVSCYGQHVAGTIKAKWLTEIESLYDDPNYRTDSISNVLYLLQELHEYSANYIEKLIDDAATQWTELKFQLLAHNIDFSEVKRRDALAHKTILSYLRRKMDDAAKNKEDKAYDRLRILYDNAV